MASGAAQSRKLSAFRCACARGREPARHTSAAQKGGQRDLGGGLFACSNLGRVEADTCRPLVLINAEKDVVSVHAVQSREQLFKPGPVVFLTPLCFLPQLRAPLGESCHAPRAGFSAFFAVECTQVPYITSAGRSGSQSFRIPGSKVVAPNRYRTGRST